MGAEEVEAADEGEWSGTWWKVTPARGVVEEVDDSEEGDEQIC